MFGCFGRIDLKLTPNRVVKLFSDTSYADLENYDIDIEEYSSGSKKTLSDILLEFNEEVI